MFIERMSKRIWLLSLEDCQGYVWMERDGTWKCSIPSCVDFKRKKSCSHIRDVWKKEKEGME